MQNIFIIILISIFYQDLKERKVTLLLLLLSILLGGITHYSKNFDVIFLTNIAINSVFLVLLFFVLYIYSKFVLKKHLLETMGLGDFLFFITLAVSFPPITFLTIFVSSLIFSLLLFKVIQSRLTIKTVPLAGFQALFVVLIILVNTLCNFVNLYQF